MYFRAIKEGGDAYMIEVMGFDYLLDFLEYCDIQNYLEKDIQKQIDRRQQRK